MNNPETQQALANYDRRDSIANSKVGAVLAMILMPAGSLLMDAFMYPNRLWEFLNLRIISALMVISVFLLLRTKWADKYYRWLRMSWYWIPMIFIAIMIYKTDDP